jgi:hypothetical protein
MLQRCGRHSVAQRHRLLVMLVLVQAVAVAQCSVALSNPMVKETLIGKQHQIRFIDIPV